MKIKQKKILVAMSGGVDSSAAAALLLGEGYDVTGAYMINYNTDNTDSDCWRDDYRDALRVAAKLGIKLLKLDFTKEYKRDVLDYMFAEYEKGVTPNPDVLCNKFVKFGAWLEEARRLGFDYLATGHYARVRKIDTNYQLLVSKDKEKDQTYFLHQLNQDQLKHVIFPIGHCTKSEVRKLAKKFDLPNADREESMGICFVGEVPMREFLQTRIKPKPGNVVLSSGEIVGVHEGLAFYTIGQRHMGLQIADLGIKNSEFDSRPLFVVAKNLRNNELVIGYEDDALLFCDKIVLKDVHWMSGQEPKFPLKCKVRLRHRQVLQIAAVSAGRQDLKMQNGELMIEFDTSQRAVTPGQFAVFYLDDDCLGGGVIKHMAI